MENCTKRKQLSKLERLQKALKFENLALREKRQLTISVHPSPVSVDSGFRVHGSATLRVKETFCFRSHFLQELPLYSSMHQMKLRPTPHDLCRISSSSSVHRHDSCIEKGLSPASTLPTRVSPRGSSGASRLDWNGNARNEEIRARLSMSGLSSRSGELCRGGNGREERARVSVSSTRTRAYREEDWAKLFQPEAMKKGVWGVSTYRIEMALAFTSSLLFAGIPAGESSTGTGGSRCSMASVKGDDDPAEEEQFQSSDFTTDRFSQGLAWDPYLGEVTANEKAEEPPLYVPPPPIPADEIRIRDKVELLLYALKRILPGQLDNDKADALCSMLSAMVEVQNPAVCFRGSNKCSEWLKALIQMKASVNLHEVYYENDMKDPDKRWVYAVWTLRFLENINTNSSDFIESSSAPEAAQLSGETVLEMEKCGLVSRISSTWYILQEDDGAFTKAKDSLLRLLGRTF